MIKKVILALSLLLAAAAPAAAQFAVQATYAGAGAGTANAQTLTLPNASTYADLLGVIVKYVPAATNTGAATLTVNGFGSSPAFRKPNGAGVTALTGGEIVSGQPTLVMYDGTYFNLITPASLPIGAAGLQGSALAYTVPTNLQINATVATNALTIAIKGEDGNDPSATNPILAAFRNVTIATGSPSIVSITSPLSFTIASTSTMGCVSGQMCRLWIVLFNNSGTPVLGAFNALSGTTIAPINEAALQTCASGTSGGSSAQTYYCSTSAVTAKAIKIIGYVEIQEVTAGTWATGPTYVQLFGPGIKKPGDVVQVQFLTTTTVGTVTNVAFTALTNTPTLAITPTSAANLIEVFTQGTYTTSNGGQSNGLRIVRGGSTVIGNPISASTGTSSSVIAPASIFAYDVTNSTSSQTYTFQGFAGGGNSASYPATSTGAVMRLREIMSSLEPANDDRPKDDRIKRIG